MHSATPPISRTITVELWMFDPSRSSQATSMASRPINIINTAAIFSIKMPFLLMSSLALALSLLDKNICPVMGDLKI